MDVDADTEAGAAGRRWRVSTERATSSPALPQVWATFHHTVSLRDDKKRGTRAFCLLVTPTQHFLSWMTSSVRVGERRWIPSFWAQRLPPGLVVIMLCLVDTSCDGTYIHKRL